MAHYAFINENNIVTEVIVGKDEDDNTDLPEGFADWEAWYADFRGQTCKRTSYNTVGGVHQNGGTPFRKNYAGIGYEYDQTRDAFIPPKPFNSWILNETTCLWEAPVAYPELTQEQMDNYNYYAWNEETKQWDLINE